MKKLTFIFVFLSSAYALTWHDISVTHNMYQADHAYARNGFFNGGGFVAKFKRDTFSLMNVEPPHIKAGCNGIDIGLGGLSFISFDELKDKLKTIMQNAQGYAFKLAISTLCKECDAILSSLEQISNAINSLNFDSCAIAANGVGYLANEISGFLTDNGNNKDYKNSKEETEKDFPSTLNTYTNAVVDKIGKVGDFFGNGNISEEDKANYVKNLGSVIFWSIKKVNKKSEYTSEDQKYQAIISWLIGVDIVRKQTEANITTNLVPIEAKYSSFEIQDDASNKMKKIFEIIFSKDDTQTIKIPIYLLKQDTTGKNTVEMVDKSINIYKDIGKVYKELSDNVFTLLNDMTTKYELGTDSINVLNNYPMLPKEFFNAIVYDNSVLKNIDSKTTLSYSACQNVKKNFLCDNLNNQINKLIKSIALKIISNDLLEKLNEFQLFLLELQNDKGISVDKKEGFAEMIDSKYLELVKNAISKLEEQSEALRIQFQEEYTKSVESIQEALKKQEQSQQGIVTNNGGKK